MNNANTRKYALSAALAVTAGTLAFTATHAQTSSRNPEVTLYGGTLTSDARLDAKGKVLEASVTVPMSVFQNAPTTMDTSKPMTMKADAVLEFPAIVRKTTFLNHLSMFWNPEGHEPLARYGVPHWDFHFFTLDAAQAAAIDCKNLAQGDPRAVAAGWLPPVPPNAPAGQFCVPLMGFHSEPVTEFKGPGVFLDGKFEKVMIGGYYQGRYQFIEPMITTATLEKRRTFSLPVPLPSSIGQATLYPTRFQAIFEKSADAYKFVFSNFKSIN